MPDLTITHEGTLQPAQEKTYVHLPFEVPAGAIRIQVEYHYSRQIGSDPLLTGGNTIDLGIFDERGIDFSSAGFRGWSGSERSSFFITATDATPGYLAGPLTPGLWHVLLGLYKIAPEGCAYRVNVTVTTSPPAPESSYTSPGAPSTWTRLGQDDDQEKRARARELGSEAAWLCGELHCHTWHSDGDRSATDVVALARSRGLDFLAISDHNTIASQRELANLPNPGLILIPGVEVTTFKGHFNVWGIPDWVDFRVQRPEEMQAALRFAAERGAVTSCGHPKPLGPPWEYQTVTNFDCVEVWNGPWTLLNQMALDYWTSLLATGRRLTAIAGSDWHRQRELEEDPPRAPGTPAVWIYVPRPASAAAILDGIRHGHVSLSDSPEGPRLDLRAGHEFSARGGDILPRGGDGKLPVQVRCHRGAGHRLQLLDREQVLFEQTLSGADETITTELSTADMLYVRAELRNANEDVRALTNPIYLATPPA